MTDRLQFLWPEIALFAATCIVMIVGLSRRYASRKAAALVAGVGLLAATLLSIGFSPDVESLPASAAQQLLPNLVGFAKPLIGIVGLLLLLLAAGTVDRREEEEIVRGVRVFDPLRSNRAEFYSFFLFSLTGLMLCADADDLIWLFLALELTSLPTYIMVVISTAKVRGREAGVKYFFLGALGAATFLYGFALLYGATGTTNLNAIASHFAAHGVSTLGMAGLLLSVIGVCFKIAAVPMHFYTADVYEGAAPQVSAFLAFVPKTAGFLTILLLCATVGWSFGPSAEPLSVVKSTAGGTQLPEVLRLTLWVIAALTMTVGNVLALMQVSVKRILAYSSIAHSGYMLVGVIVGPGDGSFTGSGVSAVLFYLLCYGVMNVGCFAVLAALERAPGRDGEPREIETVTDLRGLCVTHPALGWSMVLCSLSLLGLPPLLGFFGKLPLFTSAIRAGEIPLVIILGINSAVAAYYYLRIAFAPMLEQADESSEPIVQAPFRSRQVAAVVSAGGVVVLSILGNSLMEHSRTAAEYRAAVPSGGSGHSMVDDHRP
ncbi:MAG: NADH-quinone oxidoreductase subunit N [Phycisphaerae bacterium]|nr:NADH-quinone oxidoreductase subunit N [Phycisphaerae bacterium]